MTVAKKAVMWAIEMDVTKVAMRVEQKGDEMVE